MLFNSIDFLVAFPLYCLLFFHTPPAWRRHVLLLGSLAACASFGAYAVVWVLALTLAGYVLGLLVERSDGPWSLAGGIVLCVAPLVVLKYAGFAEQIAAQIAAQVGAQVGAAAVPNADSTLARLVVPVGLSFYTFSIVGYLIDVHWKRHAAERRLLDFAVFTTFYPKFLSGPVERADRFLPQLAGAGVFDYERVTSGLRLIAVGLVLKLVLADRIAPIVDGVYAAPEAVSATLLLLGVVLYMFQIYYDFAGYSLCAIGAALVLGFGLTPNFDRPYAARSISEYWRRWHISLSTWFFDYIFSPVNVTLRGWGRTAVVIAFVITFLVSGLWHGAQWTFVVFGLLHSAALCFEFLTTRRRRRIRKRVPARLYAVLAWATMFTFLAVVDVFFRASDLDQAFTVLWRILTGLGPDALHLLGQGMSPTAIKTLLAGLAVPKIELLLAVVGIATCEWLYWLQARRPLLERAGAMRLPVRWVAYYALAATLLFLGAFNRTSSFVYMQF